MGVLAPLLQEAGGEAEGADLGFAEGGGLQVAACHGLVEGFDGGAQGTHPEPCVLVGSGPDDVVVGEEDGGAFVEGGGAGAEAAVLGHEQVEDDLLVAGPFAGVGEDEDGFDVEGGEVAGAAGLVFFRGEFAEGGRVHVVFDDVSGGDDVGEAVAFGDVPAFLAFAADDEDGVVLCCHFFHGRVAADELARGDFELELSGQVEAPLLFGFAAAVGDEDVGSIRYRMDCQSLVSCCAGGEGSCKRLRSWWDLTL